MNDNQKKALRIFLLSHGLGSVLFTLTFTVQAVYFIQTVHMDPLQLVLVGTTLEATIFLFELPTGVVADTYSRRLSVIIGTFLWGLGFLIEGLFPFFLSVLLSQVVMGLGFTFNSGASEAWLAGELGDENVGPAFLQSSQVGRIGTIVAIIAGVGLASIQLSIPIILAGAGWVGLAVYEVIAMPETGFTREANPEHEGIGAMLKTFRDGSRVVRASAVLVLFIVLGVFTGASSEGMDRLSEAHFLKNFAFPEWGQLQPVVWFGMMDLVLLLVGLAITEGFRKRIDTNNHRLVARVVIVSSALQIAGIVGFALAGGFWWAAATYVAMRLFRGVASPLFNTWITQSIDRRVRASVLSMVSQSDAIGQVAGGPVIGWIGTAISLRAALVTSAVLLMPALPLVAAARRRVLVEPTDEVAELETEVAPATVPVAGEQ
jgi:DHA3 family tetracycline resistance protein-like MFS transporter